MKSEESREIYCKVYGQGWLQTVKSVTAHDVVPVLWGSFTVEEV
jgi:hypothetical protein